MILLAQLVTRLWQLASATVWYKNHAEVVAAESVAYTPPQPEEVIVVAETTVVAETDLPLSEPSAPPKEGSEPGEDTKLRNDL